MLPTLVLTDDAGAAATPCGTGVSTGRHPEPVGAAIAAAGAAGQLINASHSEERTRLTPNPARLSRWDRPAARHQSAVATMTPFLPAEAKGPGSER